MTVRHACGDSTQPHRRGAATTITGAARSTGATLSRITPPAKPDASRGEPLLVLEDVAKSHDGDTQLFQNVSITVCRGDRLAVVGTNGSGAAAHAPGRFDASGSNYRQSAAIAASAHGLSMTSSRLQARRRCCGSWLGMTQQMEVLCGG